MSPTYSAAISRSRSSNTSLTQNGASVISPWQLFRPQLRIPGLQPGHVVVGFGNQPRVDDISMQGVAVVVVLLAEIYCLRSHVCHLTVVSPAMSPSPVPIPYLPWARPLPDTGYRR